MIPINEEMSRNSKDVLLIFNKINGRNIRGNNFVKQARAKKRAANLSFDFSK